jgi:hypothetical protein
VLYLQAFAGQPDPDGYENAEYDLEYYMEFDRTTYVPDSWYN